MNPVNNILLLSLKHDLKSINGINLQLLRYLPEFQLKSWLFPTKKCTEIDTKVVGDNQYLKLLEYIVDKLYLMVNLMAKFLEDKRCQQPPFKSMEAPSSLSLGGASKLLWQKLEGLKSVETSKFDPPSFDASSSLSCDRYSQTPVEPISCKNCAVSITCVRSIMDELQDYKRCTLLSALRQTLKEDIYDRSQYGCLTQVSQAIIEEIRTQMSHLETLQAENIKMRTKLDSKNTKYKHSVEIIRQTNKSLQQSKTVAKNETLKNNSLSKTINDLRQSNTQLEHELAFCEQHVSTQASDLALSATNCELLKTSLKSVKLENANLSEEINSCKKMLAKTDSENKTLRAELDSCDKLEDFKRSIVEINIACRFTFEKLQKINLQIEKRSHNLENLADRVADFIDQRRINQNKRTKALRQTLPEITGDPVADMRKQLIINKASIKQLESDNRKLVETIHKIQDTSLKH
ncbi:hypothetical protein PPYR_06611 [Photinus pyralis]|uniref:Uncharacterized protein n=1 Tax=Photinus pyralis TaxID=7054 RepID=A0A5N4AN50_PHOPY|nr:uncharacterized protein LOC116167942 [Photinus pyralis]XP_031357950.1 uncharacterized protein LOC116181679 [Photinus pyralis]KAB0798731.1 hypothetical protein PPYR_06611 [Photinus pyralis]